jgi:hypothetical protein
MSTRAIHVRSARDLGPQFVENPHRMVGQDGAYSIPLEKGSFWYFGDTLIGKRTPGQSLWFPGGVALGPESMAGKHGIDRMLTNTGLILHETTGRDGLRHYRYVQDASGGLLQVVPHLPTEDIDELRVWCLQGIFLKPHLYLYYIVVRMLAEGPMPVNFELCGSGLAKGRPDGLGFERLANHGEVHWWPWPLPQFGTTVLRSREDGLLYVYGVRKGSDGSQQCCVARVAPQQIEELSAHRYWCGAAKGWGDDPGECETIMTGMPNEMSVSWNEHLGCYLAVHSLELSGQIVGRTAEHPWGPWSEPALLWQVPTPKWDYPVPSFPLIYAGKEHPQLAGENGRVLYLTYIEFEEYFPHLVEVTLA